MIDLTQLRWQSIRAIELQQSTGATLYHTTNGISSKKPYADIENITLRSKVAALKSSENSLKKESENLKAALAQTIRLKFFLLTEV
jgi:TfoX/Sxy family transcriptional regulator of competence genes